MQLWLSDTAIVIAGGVYPTMVHSGLGVTPQNIGLILAPLPLLLTQ